MLTIKEQIARIRAINPSLVDYAALVLQNNSRYAENVVDALQILRNPRERGVVAYIYSFFSNNHLANKSNFEMLIQAGANVLRLVNL